MSNQQPVEGEKETEGGLVSWVRRNRAILGNWLLFVGILGSMVAIDQYFFVWMNTTLSEKTAQGTVWILQQLGLRSSVHGTRVWSTICYLNIISECTAFYPLSIFLAAVVAFPTRWTRKLLGLVLGIPLVLGLNQVRLVSLCYVAHWIPQHFDTIHEVVWQALMVVLTVLLWLVWAVTLADDETASA